MAFQDLQVDSKRIREVVNDLRGLNQKLEGEITDMVTNEQKLNAMWDGDANTEFHKAFDHDRQCFNNLKDFITRFAAALETSAEAYDKHEDTSKQVAIQREY